MPKARPSQDSGLDPTPRQGIGVGNPYVDLPRPRPVRQSITTGLAKQIFAAAGLLTEADAARSQEIISTDSAASDIIGVSVLAALILLVAVILSGTTWQFRAGLFVTLAAIGMYVEAVWLCQLWQFAVASMLFALLLPCTHRTRTAVQQRGAMEIAGQANWQFPGALRRESPPRTVEAATQTPILQDECGHIAAERILVLPSSIVTAPSMGIEVSFRSAVPGPQRCQGLEGLHALPVVQQVRRRWSSESAGPDARARR